MIIHDPGHQYELGILDNDDNTQQILTFVKREGTKYPGNVGHHPGTTMQEVLRALIDRVKYVHSQQPDVNNLELLNHLRESIYLLEDRAARHHGRELHVSVDTIEYETTCVVCGHIGCHGACRS